MSDHDKALIAIQAMTITQLMDALETIAEAAYAVGVPLIAEMAEDAIEAAKALHSRKN